MSARSNGDRPPHIEYTAPSRKKARAAPKPLRDIGVEQFRRPGGTLPGAGHVRPGSAFDTLGRKGKEIPKKRRQMVEVARDEVGGMTSAGDEADLDSKTGRDNNTNNPTPAPDTRGETPGEVFTATDLDETLWGKQDESDDATEPQESRQENISTALQNLRPNVVRPAPASRTLKAKAGAWGASRLAKPEKDVVNVAVPSAADKAAFARRRLVTVKNKPTAEERFRKEYFERIKKPVIQTPKRQPPVDSPSLPRGPPPQKGQRKRRASPAAPVFSSEEEDGVDDEDDEDDDDIPVASNSLRRRATTASRPQLRNSQNQKATSALPDEAVVDQLSYEEGDDEDEDGEEDDEDTEDDLPIVQPNRRRGAQLAPPSQTNDSPDQPTTSPLSSNSKAAVCRLLQTVQDVSSPLSDKVLVDHNLQDDEDEYEDIPIAQKSRRRRAQPAPPQSKNIPNQPATSPLSNDSKAAPDSVLQFATEHFPPPLSNKAAIDQLLQLGTAPPARTPDLAHIPMARFPTTASIVQFPPTTFAPDFKAVNRPRPQSQLEPELRAQTLPKKGIARPPQPKRARATTTNATTNATTKKDATPSPPRKKSRAAPKGKPATKPAAAKPAAKTATKPAATKPAAAKPAITTTAAPTKKTGAAAVAGKKGVATKVIKKKPKASYDVVSVTDESGSDHDSDW